MNSKNPAATILITLAIILAGALGYMAFKQKFAASSTTPFPLPTPEASENAQIITLGQPITMRQGSIAKLINTDWEIKIVKFYNSPCPKEVQCFWSGVGTEFEYRLNGQVQKGIDLLQAFGYQTTIVKTDHQTYVRLVVEKIK